MSSVSEANIVARECRFAIHIPGRFDRPDLHFVKEILHKDDGTTVPNLKFIRDFKRPFYITNKRFRNHKDKKEFEHKDRLMEYNCTQSELRDKVAKALGTYGREQLGALCRSPYVYGADITSSAIIKHNYMTKYPNAISAYSVATFDTETDVLNGTNKIIMATVTYKNEVFTSVCKSFVEGIDNVEGRLHELLNKYLGDYVKKRNLKYTVHLADNPYDAVKACFSELHRWKPDFLAIWNMDFDIPKVMEACEDEGQDPKDLFCDPCVPEALRFFKYKQGPKKQVTASGKVKPINPSAQWHWVHTASSFVVVDAMCCYRQLRLSEQEEPSYSLDAILTKELGIRKLSFKEAECCEGKPKIVEHQFMQANYKLEYVIYNAFDCISMLELDEKTTDLSFTMPSFAGVTDFSKFKSQPKRIADAFHYYLLEQNLVLATVGKQLEIDESEIEEGEPAEDDDDLPVSDEILSLKNWIVTLPAHMTADFGLKCIAENPMLSTNVCGHVYDSDCVSSYPSDIIACNVSKETTRCEIIGIEGVDEMVFRMQNINMLSGWVNAQEYCTIMFGMPTPDQFLDMYLEQKKIAA